MIADHTGMLAKRRVLLDGLDAVAPNWERYEVSYCQYGCSMVSRPVTPFQTPAYAFI